MTWTEALKRRRDSQESQALIPESQSVRLCLRLDAIWRNALVALNKIWQPDTYEFIRTKCPDLYRRIDSVESQMNMAWKQATEGLDSTERFIAAIREWVSLHREGLNRFQAEESNGR